MDTLLFYNFLYFFLLVSNLLLTLIWYILIKIEKFYNIINDNFKKYKFIKFKKYYLNITNKIKKIKKILILILYKKLI